MIYQMAIVSWLTTVGNATTENSNVFRCVCSAVIPLGVHKSNYSLQMKSLQTSSVYCTSPCAVLAIGLYFRMAWFHASVWYVYLSAFSHIFIHFPLCVVWRSFFAIIFFHVLFVFWHISCGMYLQSQFNISYKRQNKYDCNFIHTKLVTKKQQQQKVECVVHALHGKLNVLICCWCLCLFCDSDFWKPLAISRAKK